MARILLVEDNSEEAAIISTWLKNENHEAKVAADGNSAAAILKDEPFDLIILDWNLPGMTGVEVCSKFRAANGMTPILMLTGKADTADKELGLDAGADDYMTKPVHLRELSARIRALLRRSVSASSSVLTFGDITVDVAAHKVTRNGEEIALLPREFSLLAYIVQHRNQILSLEDLLAGVWSSDPSATARVVRTCMNRLRSKLDLHGQHSIVRTVYGVGYTVGDHD